MVLIFWRSGWRPPVTRSSGIRTSRVTGGSTRRTRTATGWSSWSRSRIEVPVASQRLEGLERRFVAGQLELFGRAVALRVGLEVGDRLDLRVGLEGPFGVLQPGRAALRPPRPGHPELADDDRLGVFGRESQERAHELPDRLEGLAGVDVHAGPVDLVVARVEALRVTADEPL